MSETKFFAKVCPGSRVERVEIEQNLGIEVVHNGKSFYLHENNDGELLLSSNDTQLVLLTKASNRVQIKSE